MWLVGVCSVVVGVCGGVVVSSRVERTSFFFVFGKNDLLEKVRGVSISEKIYVFQEFKLEIVQ